MSDHLRRERDDLHESLVAQLAPHRPENAGRAPELSAILRIDSCCTTVPPPGPRRYFARSTISTTRHRLVFDSGRVSTIRTVSPAFAPLSSCAATCLVRTICLP